MGNIGSYDRRNDYSCPEGEKQNNLLTSIFEFLDVIVKAIFKEGE